MKENILSAKWFKYLIEGLTLTFILGLFCGVLIGLVRSWKYAQSGLWFTIPNIFNLSINDCLVSAFLFVCLYLLAFFILRRILSSTIWTCFLASAISFLPFFLLWGYWIDEINEIFAYNFFRWASILFNLKLCIAFVVLWVFASIGLLSWTRSRIIKPSPANLKAASVLFGIVFVSVISPTLFHTVQSREAPNVIIILTDCLRADHLSCYGYGRNTTPNIDQFAKDAVIFSQAISQSSFTKSSIASVFTSKNPYQHGVYSGSRKDTKDNIVSDVLSEEETTLAEILLQNGILTAAWLQQGHLKSYMGFDQGFVAYDDEGGPVAKIHRRVLQWARRIGKKNQFFAYLHNVDLHDPYRPQPPYDTMYGVYSDVNSRLDFANWSACLQAIRQKKITLEKDDVDQLIAYYDGLVTYIDHQIGVLLEELRRAGLYDNSLIIVTADHGDGFMEHGFISHTITLYDELIRVPMILKFPQSRFGGQIVKNQVRMIDVMPTILDLLNIRIDNKLEGFSLLNYLDESRKKDKSIYFPKYAISEVAYSGGYPLVSIRTETLKYLHLRNSEEHALYQTENDELYDLRVDPLEQNNIIDSKPVEAERFRRMALEMAMERKKKDVQEIPLDKNTIKQLKALGYVD